MAYAAADDKLMVFYEYSPLINGVNPPQDLSNLDQLLRSVYFTYFRSIAKLGFDQVVQIINYLIQNHAFVSRPAAMQLLGAQIQIDRSSNQKGDLGNQLWYVPIELQRPLLIKLLEIVEDAAQQHLLKDSPHEVNTPAEALNKILFHRVGDKFKFSGWEEKAQKKANKEANQLLRVRTSVMEGDAVDPVHLEHLFLAGSRFTESLGEIERPKFIADVRQALESFRLGCKTGKQDMSKIVYAGALSSERSFIKRQEVDRQLKVFLSVGALELRDELAKIFIEHASSLKIPYNIVQGDKFKKDLSEMPGEKPGEMQTQISSYPKYAIREYAGHETGIDWARRRHLLRNERKIEKKAEKKMMRKEKWEELKKQLNTPKSFQGNECGPAPITNDSNRTAPNDAFSAYNIRTNYSQFLNAGIPNAANNFVYEPPPNIPEANNPPAYTTQAYVPQPNLPMYQPLTQTYVPQSNPPAYTPKDYVPQSSLPGYVTQNYVLQPKPPTYDTTCAPQPAQPVYQPYSHSYTPSTYQGGNYPPGTMQYHYPPGIDNGQPQQGYYSGAKQASSSVVKKNYGYPKTEVNYNTYSGATNGSYGSQASTQTSYGGRSFRHEQSYNTQEQVYGRRYQSTQQQPYASRVSYQSHSRDNNRFYNKSKTGSIHAAWSHSKHDFKIRGKATENDRKRKSGPTEMEDSFQRNEKKVRVEDEGVNIKVERDDH